MSNSHRIHGLHFVGVGDMSVKEIKMQIALGLLNDANLLDIIEPCSMYDVVDVSKELLIYLSDWRSKRIRYYVADNSNTPKEVLTKLSTDKDWAVRCVAKCTIHRIEKYK